ncbi:hypothetical protein LJC27_02860 [Christensenellaceae bacterium OttesenSCG-928-M15]|nr:hypothetical protein [Christensenellaceae bacterium OttesenSCG-928-M15]
MKRLDLKSLKNTPKDLNEAVAGIDPSTVSQVQNVVSQYQGRSEEELITELRNVTAREKAAGNLSNERIDSIAGVLGPMLTPEQQAQMQAMIQQLKST